MYFLFYDQSFCNANTNNSQWMTGRGHRLQIVATLDPTMAAFPVARTRKYMLIMKMSRALQFLVKKTVAVCRILFYFLSRCWFALFW